MANCTYTEVRYIIATGLPDASITALITLADAEISARGLTGTPWTADMLKQLSILLTASLAAMNDVTSYGKADYQAGGGGAALSRLYRERAEELVIKGGEIALVPHNDSLDNDYESDS